MKALIKNKKVFIFTAVALILLLAAALPGAMAYFTTYVSAGGSQIINLGSTTTTHEEVSNMIKHITIENTSSNECFVRAKLLYGDTFIDVSVTDAEGAGKWTEGSDGYWYYSDILKPGELTTALDAKIAIKDEADIREFNVIVIQECIPVIYDENGNPDWSEPIQGGAE